MTLSFDFMARLIKKRFSSLFCSESHQGSVVGTTHGLESISGRNRIIDELVRHYDFNSVLDVGCGQGDIFDYLGKVGCEVKGVGCDFLEPEDVRVSGFQYIKSDITHFSWEHQFDLVVSSHVIEHVADTGEFINRMFSHLKVGGVFCLIWPPPKKQVVGGHLHVFNMGLMLYNLVRSKVDCSDVRMYRCGYNLAIMGRYNPIKDLTLSYNRYELELLGDYFPCPVKQGFDGTLSKYVVRL